MKYEIILTTDLLNDPTKLIVKYHLPDVKEEQAQITVSKDVPTGGKNPFHVQLQREKWEEFERTRRIALNIFYDPTITFPPVLTSVREWLKRRPGGLLELGDKTLLCVPRYKGQPVREVVITTRYMEQIMGEWEDSAMVHQLQYMIVASKPEGAEDEMSVGTDQLFVRL